MSKKIESLSLRLSVEESERFNEVLRRAKARNPLVSVSDLLRELLGLTKYALITAEELAYFRGEVESFEQTVRKTA